MRKKLFFLHEETKADAPGKYIIATEQCIFHDGLSELFVGSGLMTHF